MMRYFDPSYWIRCSQANRRYGDIFLAGYAEFFGRVNGDGHIELVNYLTNEPVVVINPNDLSKIRIKYDGNRHTSKFFNYAFQVQVKTPTTVKEYGYHYSYYPGQVWDPNQRRYVTVKEVEGSTDGWANLELVKNSTTIYRLKNLDPMTIVEIYGEARKAMIKEVQRVRFLLRIRAKMEIFDVSKLDNTKRWSALPKTCKDMLADVTGEDMGSIYNFISYTVHPYYAKDAKNILTAYDAWISKHRRDLYTQFGCFTSKA